jgi:signal transduction histidine kinase
MRFSKHLLTLSFLILAASPAMAANNATCAEAKAMLDKAVVTFKADGPEKAYAKFADKNGPFQDRDLYVWVVDSTGKMLFHPKNPALIGKDTSGLRDASGVAWVKNLLAIKDTGAVHYTWADPLDHKIEPKIGYAARVGDDILGVGCYYE